MAAKLRDGNTRGERAMPAACGEDRTHSGTIITQRPDELWGTDATKFWTQQEGRCWVIPSRTVVIPGMFRMD